MDAEAARTVFTVLAAVIGIIWVVGVRFAFSALDAAAEVVCGEAIVRGDAETISKKLAGQLATYTGTGAGLIAITERTASRLRFRRMPGIILRRGPFFDEGEITFTPAGESVRVRYEVSLRRIFKAMRLVLAIVCYAWGGLFVFGVPVLVWFLAVESDNPGHRWQAFQTFQMIHGAWPPYLLGVIIRFIRRIPERFFQALVANAEHTA